MSWKKNRSKKKSQYPMKKSANYIFNFDLIYSRYKSI